MKKLLTLLLLFATTFALAKPVSVTLPFPPGGATDRAWRILLPMLTHELRNDNIELVTEYRPGGGGIVAGTHVATSTTTQLLFTSASVMISLAQSENMPYRPSDFQPLGYFGTLPMMMVVPANGPNNIKEFTQLCRAKTLNMGSAGVGSTIHLVGETIMRGLRCDFVNVSYKGPPQVVPDLIAGRVDFMIDYTASSTMSMVKDSKLKNILVIGNRRLVDSPDIPTANEIGLNVDRVKNWQVLMVNSQANSADVSAILSAVQRVLANPENVKEFQGMGLEGVGTRLAPTFLQDNYNFYKKLVTR